MGYYVSVEDANWKIQETPEALRAVKEMPIKYHFLMNGGSSNGEKWFSWMNNAEIEKAESVESVFQSLGFDTIKVEGGFKLVDYNSKTGQEDLFLAVVAPWTVSGSYITWRGEDDSYWRHVVTEGKMYRVHGEKKINFTHSEPFREIKFLFDAETGDGRRLLIDINDPMHLVQAAKEVEAQEAKNKKYYDSLKSTV